MSEPLAPEEALGRLGELAVRSVADLCTIDVVESDGAVVRLVNAHGDAVPPDSARELRRFTPDPSDPDDP